MLIIDHLECGVWSVKRRFPTVPPDLQSTVVYTVHIFRKEEHKENVFRVYLENDHRNSPGSANFFAFLTVFSREREGARAKRKSSQSQQSRFVLGDRRPDEAVLLYSLLVDQTTLIPGFLNGVAVLSYRQCAQ